MSARRRGEAAGYDAFISYSHAADGKLAPSLQRGLRGFGKPWYTLRALRVFRDETSLSASPALWSGIERALGAVEVLHPARVPGRGRLALGRRRGEVLARPQAGGALLIALTDGEIAWDDDVGDFDWDRTTALPRSLERAFAAEPLWVDLRFARAQPDMSPRQPDYLDAIADLAAPMHGRDKDALVGEDIKQHRRTLRLARAAVAILAVLVLAVGASGAHRLPGGRQRPSAARQRTAGSVTPRTALALASASSDQLATYPDVSLLLGLEAYRTSPSAEARSSMISALVDARRSGVLAFLHGHRGSVRSVAFSADGRTLASVGYDRWCGSGTCAAHRPVGQPLRGHTGRVRSVAFSPDGHTLASAGDDGTVRLWDCGHPHADSAGS